MATGNLLHQNYYLTGVIDFGILGVGDPACDLAVAWIYFDDDSHKVFIQELNLDIDTWRLGIMESSNNSRKQFIQRGASIVIER